MAGRGATWAGKSNRRPPRYIESTVVTAIPPCGTVGSMAPTTAFTLAPEVRALLDAPNYVHLSTLRRDGRPRNWVVWVGLEGDRVLICTTECSWKAKDMRREPRVGLSVLDAADPYRSAALQGRSEERRVGKGGRARWAGDHE